MNASIYRACIQCTSLSLSVRTVSTSRPFSSNQIQDLSIKSRTILPACTALSRMDSIPTSAQDRSCHQRGINQERMQIIPRYQPRCHMGCRANDSAGTSGIKYRPDISICSQRYATGGNAWTWFHQANSSSLLIISIVLTSRDSPSANTPSSLCGQIEETSRKAMYYRFKDRLPPTLNQLSLARTVENIEFTPVFSTMIARTVDPLSSGCELPGDEGQPKAALRTPHRLQCYRQLCDELSGMPILGYATSHS